jgi:hypothetical protein
VLDALQKTRHPHFHELVQVAGRNSQKLDALQQRVFLVARLFQHALVKLQPLNIPVEIVARIVQFYTFHKMFKGTDTIT